MRRLPRRCRAKVEWGKGVSSSIKSTNFGYDRRSPFAPMIRLFEAPLPAGAGVYPCTVEDLRERLAHFPPADVEDLWAVGLVPSTRKDCSAHARYFYPPKPSIYVYSYAASLRIKQPAHTTQSDVERGLAVELAYGMDVELHGARWYCQWQREALRRFIVEHVLPHEVGHHVYGQRRRRAGLEHRPRTRESEQFAEAYALRQRCPSRGGNGGQCSR